ncbi:MAG: hypothetical protein ACRC33_05095, partial [Gemmataceae bacterium]
WLSAGSLALGQDARAYLAVQALLVASIPFALAAIVFRAVPSSRRRALAVLVALLGGAAVASFVADRGQGFQTEGFGVLPAAVPALLLAWSQSHGTRWWGAWVAASAFAVAILLKEPFLLTGVAAMGWLVRSRRDVIWMSKVVALAGTMSLALLVGTGTAGDYFGVYLPEILQGRLSGQILYHDYRIDRFVQIPTPAALRSVDLARLFRDVFPQTPFRTLGLALAALVACRAWWFDRRRFRWRLTASAAVVTAVVLGQKSFEMRQVVVLIEQLGRAVPWGDPVFIWKVVDLTAPAAAGLVCLAALARARQWGLAAEIVRAVAVLYLATLAASLGGDSPAHHVLFAAPVYLAVIADASIRWGRREGGRPGTVLVAAIVLAFAAGTVGGRYDYVLLRTAQAALQQEQHRWRERAARLDDVLVACGEERYALADHRVQELQALTRHSPVQLTYGMQRAYDDRQHGGLPNRRANLVFHVKMARDLDQTRVFVFGSGTGRIVTLPGVEDRLRHNNADVPDCARPLLPIAGLELSFQRLKR